MTFNMTLTFLVGFSLVFCGHGAPIPDTETDVPEELPHVITGQIVFYVSTGFLIICGIAILGCACCLHKDIQQGESDENHNCSLQFSENNPALHSGSEFAIFPPCSSVISLQPVYSSSLFGNEVEKVVFEPLPDILPKMHVNGQSLAQSSKPAHFSALLKMKTTLNDWFDDPGSNFPRSNLQYVQEIGNGWFGCVVEGEAKMIIDGQEKTPVVVKILREEASPSEHLYFLHDVQPYRDLQHPNVLRLLGRCLESDPFLLIMEHTNINLKTYLTCNRNEIMKEGVENYSERFLQIVSDVASGLSHMHEHGFIHSDLAAHNCFIGMNNVVKIGDYGLSFDMFKEDYYCVGEMLVPIRWLAPESIAITELSVETQELTKEANIWSLGVVFWEILELGELPYLELTDQEVIQKVIMERKVHPRALQVFHPYKTQMYQLMEHCWQAASCRLKADTIVMLLRQLSKTRKLPESFSSFEQRWDALQSKNHLTSPHSIQHKFENDFVSHEHLQSSAFLPESSSESFNYDSSSYELFQENIDSCRSPSLRALNGSFDELQLQDCDENNLHSRSLNQTTMKKDPQIDLKSGDEVEVVTCEQITEAIRDLDDMLASEALILGVDSRSATLERPLHSKIKQKGMSVREAHLFEKAEDEEFGSFDRKELNKTYVTKSEGFLNHDDKTDSVYKSNTPSFFSSESKLVPLENSSPSSSLHSLPSNSTLAFKTENSFLGVNSSHRVSKKGSLALPDILITEPSVYHSQEVNETDEGNGSGQALYHKGQNVLEKEYDSDSGTTSSDIILQTPENIRRHFSVPLTDVDSGNEDSPLSSSINLADCEPVTDEQELSVKKAVDSALLSSVHDQSLCNGDVPRIQGKQGLFIMSHGDTDVASEGELHLLNGTETKIPLPCSHTFDQSVVEEKSFSESEASLMGHQENYDCFDNSGKYPVHKRSHTWNSGIHLGSHKASDSSDRGRTEESYQEVPHLESICNNNNEGIDKTPIKGESYLSSDEKVMDGCCKTETELQNIRNEFGSHLCNSSDAANDSSGGESISHSSSKFSIHTLDDDKFPSKQFKILNENSGEIVACSEQNKVFLTALSDIDEAESENSSPDLRLQSLPGNNAIYNGQRSLTPLSEELLSNCHDRESEIADLEPDHKMTSSEEYDEDDHLEPDEVLKIDIETNEAILVDTSESLIGFVPSRSIELLQECDCVISNFETPTNAEKSYDNESGWSDEEEDMNANHCTRISVEDLTTDPISSYGENFMSSDDGLESECEKNDLEITASPNVQDSSPSHQPNDAHPVREPQLLPRNDNDEIQNNNNKTKNESDGGELNNNNKYISTDLYNDILFSIQPTKSVIWHSDETLDVLEDDNKKNRGIVIEGEEVLAGFPYQRDSMLDIQSSDISCSVQFGSCDFLDRLDVSGCPSPSCSVSSTPSREMIYTPDFESESEESSSSCSSTSGSFECIHNKFKNISDISSESVKKEASPLVETTVEPSPLKIFSKTWDCHATPNKGLLKSPEKKLLPIRKSVSFHEDPHLVFQYPPASDSSEDDCIEHDSVVHHVDYTSYADWELHASEDDEIPEEMIEIEELEAEPYNRSLRYRGISSYPFSGTSLYTLTGFSEEDLEFPDTMSISQLSTSSQSLDERDSYDFEAVTAENLANCSEEPTVELSSEKPVECTSIEKELSEVKACETTVVEHLEEEFPKQVVESDSADLLENISASVSFENCEDNDDDAPDLNDVLDCCVKATDNDPKPVEETELNSETGKLCETADIQKFTNGSKKHPIEPISSKPLESITISLESFRDPDDNVVSEFTAAGESSVGTEDLNQRNDLVNEQLQNELCDAVCNDCPNSNEKLQLENKVDNALIDVVQDCSKVNNKDCENRATGEFDSAKCENISDSSEMSNKTEESCFTESSANKLMCQCCEGKCGANCEKCSESDLSSSAFHESEDVLKCSPKEAALNDVLHAIDHTFADEIEETNGNETEHCNSFIEQNSTGGSLDEFESCKAEFLKYVDLPTNEHSPQSHSSQSTHVTMLMKNEKGEMPPLNVPSIIITDADAHDWNDDGIDEFLEEHLKLYSSFESDPNETFSVTPDYSDKPFQRTFDFMENKAIDYTPNGTLKSLGSKCMISCIDSSCSEICTNNSVPKRNGNIELSDTSTQSGGTQ